ncbi:MAG: SpoIIE family protein phosphatase [Acidimicrobiales bacterium]
MSDILVVDDAPDALMMARRTLRKAGHDVRTAGTAAEAEAAWAQAPPDLVLLDVNLPDGNGVELSNRWKQDPDRVQVPIILWSTVSVSAAEQALGLDSGADGYLTDPVEPEVLVATVASYLRIAELIDDLDRANDEAVELVRYSLALGQAETPDQVATIAEMGARRAFGADSVRLEWRRTGAGRGHHHEAGERHLDELEGAIRSLDADAEPTFGGLAGPALDGGADAVDLGVVPFRVVDLAGALAFTAPSGSLDEERRRGAVTAFTSVTALSLARVEALHLHRSIADTLQDALLPRVTMLDGILTERTLLVAEGATIAGGDWFDGYPIDTDDGPRQIFVIGDVVGHGAAAGARSAVFRHSLRALLLSGTPVEDALRVLAEVLDDHPAEPKGTVLLIEIEPSTGDCRFFSAGHLPPVVVGPDCDSRLVDVRPCPPMGFGLPAICTPTHDRLAEGEHLVVFTDGVVEERGVSVDDGYVALQALLHEIDDCSPGRIIDDVRAMLDARSRDDDALVVGIGFARTR